MASNDDMSTTVNRLVGGLINAILGALILWVGQTTFKHAGILAGMDEKLKNVEHRFEDVEKQQENLKGCLQDSVADMKDTFRNQFSMKDGDKVFTQLRQAEQSAAELERKLSERINSVELRLTALATQNQGTQEVALLKNEIGQLRGELARAAAVQEVQYQQAQPSERFARGVPIYLPPVDSRR
jgi:hypothetical protein